MDYWKDCIKESFEDAKIEATQEQINIVSSWVEGAHENYSMANGYDFIPSPVNTEIEKLKKELKREREKTICRECNGSGRIITYGGTFQSDSQCYKCNGSGYIY